MSVAIEKVEKMFEDRLVEAAKLIKKSGIKYKAVGVFGSYARGDYKATSDIDFIIIPDGEPDRHTVALLKSDLDDIKCHLAMLSEDGLRQPSGVIYLW